MTRLTEGHLVRHYQGMRDARDAALLDIAQDYALYYLHQLGLFEGGLVFKGGTALRKFRAGSSGRFSTDLDFVAADDDLALAVFGALESVTVGDFSFALRNYGPDGRRAELHIETPFGIPALGAKVEVARHALTLKPELLQPQGLPIHSRYDFVIPSLPIVKKEEAIAEKMARYRRVPLVRDLYDLAWFADSGVLDEPLIRRLWVLKTYRDVVVDDRGDKPIDPREIIESWTARHFREEDIGYLTKAVRIDEWLRKLRNRFSFVADFTHEEKRWADLNPRNLSEVLAALEPEG